jgi:hypothetical protein
VRDALRTIIKGAALYGRLRPDGCIEYDQSLINTALAAGISRPTLNLVRPLLFEKTGIRRAPPRASYQVTPLGQRADALLPPLLAD